MATATTASATNTPPPFVFKAMNAIMLALLRSPFHGALSNTLIILSFKGQKSGKTYTLPVGYMRNGDEIKIVSSRGWWKNLRGNVPVTLWLKGQKRQGIAEAFHGDENVVEALIGFAQHSSQLRKLYSIELDANGQPNLESVRQAAQHSAFIRIRLTS